VVHEHSDLPGYEVVKGVKLLRALPVFSERLGLNGKCDLVEVHALGPTGEAGGEAKTIGGLVPVEFKVGKRRKWENDDAQLCAQALCLEEMFGGSVPRGAVFHAESKRRRDVEFTPELRLRTEESAAALQALLHTPADAVLPAAVFKPGCEKCSLYDTCLPRLTGSPELVARAAAQLFKT
jgi:CRISPR-associated exonuclease Cas4